jgi:RNA polymerase sigma-70 factor (ECF subfamily)
VEETVFDSLQNEALHLAVESLVEPQRRRFILYHEFGFTYEQIAKIEGCTKMPVKRSVIRAEEKIREKIKNFSN